MNRVLLSGRLTNITDQGNGEFWLQTDRGDFAFCKLAPFFCDGFVELQENDEVMLEGSLFMNRTHRNGAQVTDGRVWVTRIEAIRPHTRAKEANKKWSEVIAGQNKGEYEGYPMYMENNKLSTDLWQAQRDMNQLRRETQETILKMMAGGD
jgi:hypothetical protein